MQTLHPYIPTFEHLPKSLPIFPLAGAVFLPQSNLPLNIFEPRYLKMVQDSMRGNQLIGMIQPADQTDHPNLYEVGCAGRITQYIENPNGQIQIGLTGVCRFTIRQELSSLRGYRIVAPDWSSFEQDYDVVDVEPANHQDDTPSASFRAALHHYFAENSIEADWDVLSSLSTHSLLSNMFSHLPLSIEDKQLLLETSTATERLIAFTAILSDESQPKGNPQ
ncbi:LON peptidase substrate-binding domain-containing protein [Arenicella xantha]|uniref:Lon N-terminal domain-containing protein n=1 Tax=Arenicella xantha TaxID=644221 RepID=A0A395JRJ3_9GAMM|nr:LON peptidase substrate-binding domain-containing protein [Arenicella xantha]RBP53185.1 hypothetical protein DFR28_101570 [Arenicella xantha]